MYLFFLNHVHHYYAPSLTVFFLFQVLRTMKNLFHECLAKCKALTSDTLIASLSKKELEGVSADKLIYNYAIEMCQSAALEELFGDIEVVSCIKLYNLTNPYPHESKSLIILRFSTNDDPFIPFVF